MVDKYKEYFHYIPNIITKDEENKLLNLFDGMDDFKKGYFFNKEIPRLQKWYQMDGHYFSKNWIYQYDRWESHSYIPKLLQIQKYINNKTQDLLNIEPKFNSCLVNLYRNGKDCIRPHSDSESSFGDEPIISILSLGETRDIIFEKKIYDKDNIKSTKLDKNNQHHNKQITLESGSLLIMYGPMQKEFTHSIPKVNEEIDKRYSLTFREYLT